MNDLNIENSIDNKMLYSTNILIKTIQAKEKKINSKVCYQFKNNFYPVEQFASILFKENGYDNFNGVEFNRALSYLSFNFDYDSKQEENYMLMWNENLTREDLHQKFNKLISLRNDVIIKQNLDRKIIDLAEDIIKYYYKPSEEKIKTISKIFNFIRALDNEEIIKLIKFSFQIRGLKKGTPDLIIFKNNEYWLVEVKSSNDSLSRYQVFYINYFKKIVGENVFVLSFVDGDWS
jgi:hypothetical protein